MTDIVLPLVFDLVASNFRKAVDRAMRKEAQPGEVEAAREAVFEAYNGNPIDPGVARPLNES